MMADGNTVVGKAIHAVTSPIGLAASALAGPAELVGNTALKIGSDVAKKVAERPAVVAPPTSPTAIDISSAEFAAEQKQGQPRGRAANILSGQNGSLLSSQNLYSASKQLLGS